MTRPCVHVIGAGLSGLTAAVHLAATGEVDIVVHESAAFAGGRRRPLYDEATETSFDNGAEFILSSWPNTLALIDAVGARAHWRDAAPGGIAFADLASGERWTLPTGRNLWPWRLLSSRRRAPGVRFADYRPARKLGGAPAAKRLTDYVPRVGPAAERLWRPLALSALGVDPERASARLAGAALGAAGWGAARLLAPARGLTRALVEPALKTLARRGASLRFERRLTGLHLYGGRVASLEFADDHVDLEDRDIVILATPPQVAMALAPGVSAPQEFSAAVHVHFSVPAPRGAPPVLGVVHGAIHWLLGAEDSLTAAIYDAGALIDRPRERVAADAWRDVAALTGHSDTMPAWRVVRRPRANFAATPEQDALRPPSETIWRNLFLAGAYVQTGLPDCLESSARSGAMAAERALALLIGR